MEGPGELWRRLRFLFQRHRFHSEMEEELRFHVERKTERNQAGGMVVGEAARAARVRVGNFAALEARSRETWGWSWLDRLMQDIRFACRGLIGNRAFLAIVILTFACGIGVTTAIFSGVHALLLNPYPFPRSDRLVSVEAHHISGKNSGAGWLDFRDWQRQNTVFESMAIFPWAGGYTLTGFGEPQLVNGAHTTADFLQVLGVAPVLGRFFSAEEDKPGAPLVAVLSYAFWQERFARDPSALGKAITLEGKQYTIIGVLPRRFVMRGTPTCDFFTPLRENSSSRSQHQYDVIARLRPGITLTEAQSQLTSIAQRLEQQYPATNKGWGITVRPLRESFTEGLRGPMMILSGAVGFVLLLACVTVSGLLLARTLGRAKEVAVRASLGATRFRILRQMVTESMVLSCTGGAAGVLLAMWIMKVGRAAAPDGLGLDVALRLDPLILAFALGISILSGILSGVWPAWHISGVDPNSVLKSDGNAWSRTRSRNRWMFGLVAGETVLSVLLLTNAGLLSKSLMLSLHADTGIAVEHVLTFGIHLPQARYRTNSQAAAFYRDLIERLNQSPGVEKAAGVATLPMTDDFTGASFQVEGRPKAADWVDTRLQ
jgi:putative ABC transport system permease protein